MNTNYTRCAHVDTGTNEQCISWFPKIEGQKPFCPLHKDSLPARVVNHDVKPVFVEFQNEQRVLCEMMTLDQLDEHIASIEAVIERKRTELYCARAVKSEKIENLDENERRERRSKSITKGVLSMQSAQKDLEDKRAEKKKEKDPIQAFMKKFGLTEKQARKLLED